uniref:Uncharacterized protein n=1 Tax=Panagrolaimus sp. JU765 TaxID=591449 RepID=A0AC34RAE0_9BILA
MRIVIGISYKEVPGEASGSTTSTTPILTVNRTSPEIYYDYVYDVYDITSQKYIEEAVCANTSPENIILEL